MAKQSKHEAAIPNPALEALSLLVGEWNTVGSHRLLPDTLHGQTSFEWLEGGAFLKMVSEVKEPGVPSAIAIVGSDDDAETYFMLYFDERGVSRKYEMTLRDNIWKLCRNAPIFSQRFTGTFGDQGDSFVGVWELSEDDVTWKHDLEVTYRRLK
jgi:hypothetical protein